MPEICPFLAASHDPDSVLNYPSAANVCTKLGDPQPVASDHQAGYCLRARHWFCPVYTGAIRQPPVPIQIEPEAEATVPRAPRESREARLRQLRRNQARRLLIGVAVVLIGGGALYGGVVALKRQQSNYGSPAVISSATMTASSTLTSSPTLTSTSTDAATVTPTAVPSDSSTVTAMASVTLTATSTPSASPTASPSSSPTLTATISPTAKACEVPSGWQRYTVSVGETYYHIAVKFGTTVDLLQRVNCLLTPDRLLAGQVLSVPPAPPGK